MGIVHESEKGKDDQSLAVLAGGLVHEIRNPLSTMALNLDLTIEELSEPQSQREIRIVERLRKVQAECGRLEEMLNDFLQFVRAGELQLEDCNLNDLVDELVEFNRATAEKKKVEVSLHLYPGLPTCRIDVGRIRQALLNVIQNAQQAMPDGGIIEIQTSVSGNTVQVQIIDNGIGMEERVRSQIFSTFFSTKPGGSGLGLPTARRIIEVHGGTISCESEPGKGTRFSIRLPLEVST